MHLGRRTHHTGPLPSAAVVVGIVVAGLKVVIEVIVEVVIESCRSESCHLNLKIVIESCHLKVETRKLSEVLLLVPAMSALLPYI